MGYVVTLTGFINGIYLIFEIVINPISKRLIYFFVKLKPMSAPGCDFNWSTQHFILSIKRWSVNMTYRTRINYSVAQKTEMWDRWQRGESLKAIGRVFDRPSSSIFGVLSPSGGIRPADRKRSRLALSLQEREEISRGLVAHLSLRSIAFQLRRSRMVQKVECVLSSRFTIIEIEHTPKTLPVLDWIIG